MVCDENINVALFTSIFFLLMIQNCYFIVQGMKIKKNKFIIAKRKCLYFEQILQTGTRTNLESAGRSTSLFMYVETGVGISINILFIFFTCISLIVI